MAIFGNKNKDGSFTINFMAVEEALPNIAGGTAISANVGEREVVFKPRIAKETEVRLPLDRITGFDVVTEEEIIEVSKSTVKRAVIGGLLLGRLGAVVGAIDGTGVKKKRHVRKYALINYTSSDGETAALPLEIVGATLGLDKFEKRLREVVPNLATKSSGAPKSVTL